MLLRRHNFPLISTISRSARTSYTKATLAPPQPQRPHPSQQLTQPSTRFSSLQRVDTAEYKPTVSPALLRSVLAEQRNAPPVATFEDTYIFGPPTMSSPPRSASAASLLTSRAMRYIDTEQWPSADQPNDSIPTFSPSAPISSSMHLPSPLFTRKTLPPLSLMELVQRLTSELANPHLDLDSVHSLMAAYDASLNEWQRFAFWDESKRYTRNLIATDYSTFTLMLLCWNPLQGSPVHDHASSECFMRVIQGQVQETQYDRIDQPTMQSANSSDNITAAAASHSASAIDLVPTSPLSVRRAHTVSAGGVLFINDSIGLHKIDNPFNAGAVTLHCYIPPYDSCRLYDEQNGHAREAFSHFYSENGERMPEH